jgi:hypoxanthine phosphoribosyltransferase
VSGSETHEVLTWERFGVAIGELASAIVADGFRPDMVLAVARGGLPVAGALAYALDVKNCFTMNVAFYTGIDERLEMPVVLPPTLDKVDITGTRVLVADDVADTGKTLELVRREVAEFVADARSAVLYLKPWSVVIPEYVWAETDRWIDFPWSAMGPVTEA